MNKNVTVQSRNRPNFNFETVPEYYVLTWSIHFAKRSSWKPRQGTDDFFITRMFFFYLVCEAIGTAANPGLLCQPRVIVKMIVEKLMQCRLAGET
jgi:hypothetical protein